MTAERPAKGVVVLRIAGSDVGEFGDGPFLLLEQWLGESQRTLDLFIDASKVRGASMDVSGDWAVWLGKHRAKWRTVTMLTNSAFIHLTAKFVRRFAELEDIMRICTEPAVFEGALRGALESV
jgi:hypothetical protein